MLKDQAYENYRKIGEWEIISRGSYHLRSQVQCHTVSGLIHPHGQIV